MIRAAIPLLIVLVGIGSRFVSASQSSASQSSAAAGSGAANSAQNGKTPAPTANVNRSIGFRSTSQLNSHFDKHGHEFGSISKARYLSMAQELRDAPLSSTVVEDWQVRGNWSRFDRASGAFIAFRKDKVILTFFRPDDGEDYFRRASKRKP